jgi:predicted transcriptional regulator
VTCNPRIRENNEAIVEVEAKDVLKTETKIVTMDVPTTALDQREQIQEHLLRIALRVIDQAVAIEPITAGHPSLLEIKVEDPQAADEMTADATTEAGMIAVEGVTRIATPVREDRHASSLQSQSLHSPKACSKEKNHCVHSPILCSS